nr:peptidylprolyl isomerase [Streptomyces sp. SID5468]
MAERLAAIRRGPLGDRLPGEDTPAGVRLRRWVAQLLAAEALVVHETRRAVPAQYARGRTPADAAAALFAHVTAGVTVPEEEVRRYYRANPDLWARPEVRTVCQAVRPDRAAALAVRTDELGPPERLLRGQLSGAFENAVFAAAPGEWIAPARTPFGWHAAVVRAVEPARTEPYEAVRDAVHADLLAAARGSVFDDWLAARRAEVVRLAPGYEHPGDPSLPDAVHRH